MFPQNSALSLPLRDTPPETQKALNQVLTSDSPQNARVARVSPDANNTGASRIVLEINGKTIQLITKQPLQAGAQLQVSLTLDGKLLLQQTAISSAPATSTTPSNTKAVPANSAAPSSPTPPPAISLKAGISEVPISKGTVIEGTVIRSTPTGAPTIPAASSNTSSGSSTYNRPIPTGNLQTTPAPAPAQQQPTTAIQSTPSGTAPGSNTQAAAPAPVQGTPVPASSSELLAQQRSETLSTLRSKSNLPTQNTPPVTAHTANKSLNSQTSAPPSSSIQGITKPTSISESRVQQRPETLSTARAVATAQAQSGNTVAPASPATAHSPSSNAPVSTQLPQAGHASPPSGGPASTTNAQPSSHVPVQRNASASLNPSTTGTSSNAQTQPPPASTIPSVSSSGTATTPSNTTFNLDIRLNSGQTTTLQSNIPLSPSTVLTIQRTSGGEILATPLPTTSQATELQREQAAIQAALRTALPNQQPLANSLNQLQGSANQLPQTEISGLVRSMLQLFGLRPGTPEAPQTLRQNVQAGGTQTEAQLAAGKPPGKTDMKGLLRQLQQHSADLPVEQRQRMEQLIQTMQSRITQNQLSSLQQWKEAPDGSFERVIQLDIPVLNNNQMDNLELRISQERSAHGTHELTTLWRARLHFDLEELGAIDAEIKLTSDEQVQIQFWCNERHAQRHIQKQLQEFGQLLQNKGFETPELQCYHGHSPDRQGEVIQKNLVDIHT
ncbi:flagellar hook-length control protein FliK [Pontibacterium sp.]|uniref:flagellar hook-length control protein FliK n=1 Tax=Pontibacterium sp. TaxID=2036026 RepID=UPI0035664E6D